MDIKPEHLLKLKESHQRHLAMQNFYIPHDVLYTFSEDERFILKKYGNWLQALEKNTIKPYSLAQERFQQVCSNDLEATSDYEIVWVKFKKALQYKEIKLNKTVIDEERKRKITLELDNRQVQLAKEKHYKVNEKVTTNWVNKPINIDGKSYSICPVCGGDGGVSGGCFKCDGTGWI